MGYWADLERFWAAHQRGLYGYPVNRWSIKRPPNDPKLDRRSTGAIPRPLGKPRSVPRKFNTRSRKKVKGDAGEHRSAVAKRATGKMLGFMRHVCKCDAHDGMI